MLQMELGEAPAPPRHSGLTLRTVGTTDGFLAGEKLSENCFTKDRPFANQVSTSRGQRKKWE